MRTPSPLRVRRVRRRLFYFEQTDRKFRCRMLGAPGACRATLQVVGEVFATQGSAGEMFMPTRIFGSPRLCQ